ncbi:sodium-translocating pyrophosphatase [Streptomyces rapamycinicus]|uniref:K(+)-insensitive pyrophosphate-energized proton pump n=2 Tax=Streptomyces rapamycinicus TaxID=1226757 RepID=A0A0A0NII3_STRRN|nr:sodium-translocating pyrophosphatase [Streptomyces rapamycinicus]AGP56789.1 potassium transporter [Streptomyces rapamycinicus NRRL 5491]MBB4784401.1 K(+)-stimulated pyrophosphate-energized sodium pump [Streptomyces rapamycinicus]RLV80115.1 potassium transporter [Streptomyces rapamycinicus NRRL 5491]UTO64715.1 sodium-translocating pyrophosphatase [Streptomyces rapamycinicus]UTP32671.1 sodium-translocating pyrophosphatase [Streptomyces rapamycinicus NRRL 5491]
MAGPLTPHQLDLTPTLAAAELTDDNRVIVLVIAAVAIAALAVAVVLVRQVLAAGEGTDSMKKIAEAVQEGANAYLARQLRTLGGFAVVVFFLLMLLPADDWPQRIGRSVFFLIGAAFSAATGYIGMWLAVRSNVRVAAAAREATPEPPTTPVNGDSAASSPGKPSVDLTAVSHKAMKIAFRTGGVVGMCTVGLGLLGASCVVLVYAADAPKVLEGFGLGAALIAMFMRVGGGIFTKAADVGADLVGKVEKGIPEDDPRNAATIADNVGDNVGDCAGMAADLFESYAVTLVAALILGKAAFGDSGLAFPLLVPAIGVVTAMIGIFAVAPRRSDRSGMSAINRGFFISALISMALVAIAVFAYLPSSYADLDGVTNREILGHSGDPRVLALVAVAVGIVLAALIQQLTGYFTETTRRPVRDVGKTSLTGPATVVLSGISLGLESAVYSAVLIGLSVYGAFLLGGTSIMLALFAVALAGTGLLTTVGVIVAMDTFGPVSDNAQGIAEMSGDVEGAGAQVLTDLDAVGNTTKAITKGIAIATAVLAAAALFGSYRDAIAEAVSDVHTSVAGEMNLNLDISQPNNLVGLVLGAAVVFLFSGLAINAVSRSAGAVVFEVRRQFREKPGIMDYSEKPEYGRVVDICTKDALRELATPGLLAVMAPIAVGFTFGVGALGSFLAGAIGTGTLMAVFLANSGGAWDNAKKLVEDGHHGGKGSEAHAATVIGDTVGDPFKDTAGPAINPLLKVMNLVALLIAPAVVKFSYGDDASPGLRAAVAVIAVVIIVTAVYISKRRGIAVGDEDNSERVAKSADAAVVS